jgi:lysyl-tRNA synthetase class 1
VDAFLAQVVVDDLATSFVRITREFLLKRAELERQVQETLKQAPLMAHMPQMIMSDDHVAAKIGSVGEDSFGRLFHQAKIAFQFVTPWLAQTFGR